MAEDSTARTLSAAGAVDEVIASSERLAEILDSGEVTESGIVPAMSTKRLRTAIAKLNDALEGIDEPALHVSDSGRELRLPNGEDRSLATRRAPRLILIALADARRNHPGHALSVSQLVSAGWPGERVGVESAATRVYTAIRTLRSMGLEHVLLRQDDGYLLDPTVPLRRP